MGRDWAGMKYNKRPGPETNQDIVVLWYAS